MPNPKLQKRIFELRYERGYRYLDRCGEAMLVLDDALPEVTKEIWMPVEAVPSGAKLKCPALEVVIAFDTTKLVIEQSSVEKDFDFADLCSITYALISARFDIRTVVRLGQRRYHMRPSGSVEEAEADSAKFGSKMTMPDVDVKAMPPKNASWTVTHETPDKKRGFRFSFQPVWRATAVEELDERLRVPSHLLPRGQREALIEQIRARKQREKDPDAGVMFDLDYYEVRPEKVDVKEFVNESAKQADEIVYAFVKGH